MDASWFNLIFAAVVAIATVVYVRETVRLRRAQTEPCVIVYLSLMPDAPTCFELVMENIGPGVAHDVRIKWSRTIPRTAFGIEAPQSPDTPPLDVGPFINGVTSLPPKQSRRHMWGQYGGIEHILKGGPLIASVWYRDALGQELSTVNEIELTSFDGLGYTDSEQRLTRKHLEKIAKSLDAIASGRGKLTVKSASSIRPPAKAGESSSSSATKVEF